MPDDIRAISRTGQHPALAVTCPHCGAHDRAPCTTRSGRRRITDAPVHPARITAWVIATAVCPACQVAPGTPCRVGGRAIPEPHPQRVQEAEVTA
ncbi:hypothetical protein [Streptomyces qinglanensis]|nr:hypothetical protein [Streptomyces qinglanensis]